MCAILFGSGINNATKAGKILAGEQLAWPVSRHLYISEGKGLLWRTTQVSPGSVWQNHKVYMCYFGLV